MIKDTNNKLIERIKYSLSKKGPLRRDYDEKTTFNKEASFIINYLFAGFNDATAGAILPAVQKKYHLSFTLVSTLFVCNLIGWIAAAILTPEILKYLTVGRAICLLNAIAIIPATVIAAGSPFPVMAIMFTLFGISLGGMESIANAWMSARPHKRIRLSILHFAYGLGAIFAPLAGTPFVVKGWDFHHFYLASLGLCILNTIFVSFAFRWKKEGYPGEQEEVHLQARIDSQPAVIRTTSKDEIELQVLPALTNEDIKPAQSLANVEQQRPTKSTRDWQTLLRQKDTHIFSIFCLFYVGTEVSIGGWTSTYIIKVRDNIDDSGHIVSGFWTGLAAGRVLLLPFTHLLGAQLATLVYLLLSIILQLTIWLVPNVIANAVALALMGMLLGPLYPIMIELISFRIIPRSIQTFGIGYIVSYGCAGSALFPYIIGVIIQKYGAKALAPILVITLCVQFIAFLFLGIPGLRNSSAGEAQRAIE